MEHDINKARTRRLGQALFDGAAWSLAIAAAVLARVDFDAAEVHWGSVLITAVAAGGLQILVGWLLMLYRGRYVYASFDEVLGVAMTVAIVTAVLEVAVIVGGGTPRVVPASAPVIAAALALLLMVGLRYAVRARRQTLRRPATEAEPALLFGVGEAGVQLVRSMQSNPSSPYRLVGLLDDDPTKSNLRVRGVRVLGTRARIPELAEKTGATTLVVGIASADSVLLRQLSHIAESAGLTVKVIPTWAELSDGTVDIFDVRDIDETDLLGRHQISIDLTEVESLLRGRRVLITGAGGSIGSELARQVHHFHPAALGLLDRDESGLHAVQLSIHGRALLDDEGTILADIRDVARIREAIETFRPDVVFHAAALKHLPLLERYPAEAVKTNVVGTLNVLRACQQSGVAVFVNISTDKAADPISVLGYSKRITERLTATVGSEASGTYVSVRFGNVLGSRGSVLHAFAGQIAADEPLTVTHRDITRYFMTIPEAVQLVLQATAIGDDGDVLVLDMGEPVRIADVARQLIEHSGKHLDIVYTGLRPGEKLHEDLFGTGEADRRPHHRLVSEVPVPAISERDLARLEVIANPDELRDALRTLACGQDQLHRAGASDAV